MQLGEQRLDVEAGGDRREQPGQPGQLGEVGHQRRPGARVLQLDRDLAAVGPHRAVHLADAGRGGRGLVEVAEAVAASGGRTARRAPCARWPPASAARPPAAWSAPRGRARRCSSGSAASNTDSAWPSFIAPPLSSPRTVNSCSAVRACRSAVTSSADCRSSAGRARRWPGRRRRAAARRAWPCGRRGAAGSRSSAAARPAPAGAAVPLAVRRRERGLSVTRSIVPNAGDAPGPSSGVGTRRLPAGASRSRRPDAAASCAGAAASRAGAARACRRSPAGSPPSRKASACRAATPGDHAWRRRRRRRAVAAADGQLHGERRPGRVAVAAVQVGAAQAAGQPGQHQRADDAVVDARARRQVGRAGRVQRVAPVVGSTGPSTARTTRSGALAERQRRGVGLGRGAPDARRRPRRAARALVAGRDAAGHARAAAGRCRRPRSARRPTPAAASSGGQVRGDPAAAVHVDRRVPAGAQHLGRVARRAGPRARPARRPGGAAAARGADRPGAGRGHRKPASASVSSARRRVGGSAAGTGRCGGARDRAGDPAHDGAGQPVDDDGAAAELEMDRVGRAPQQPGGGARGSRAAGAWLAGRTRVTVARRGPVAAAAAVVHSRPGRGRRCRRPRTVADSGWHAVTRR